MIEGFFFVIIVGMVVGFICLGIVEDMGDGKIVIVLIVLGVLGGIIKYIFDVGVVFSLKI